MFSSQVHTITFIFNFIVKTNPILIETFVIKFYSVLISDYFVDMVESSEADVTVSRLAAALLNYGR